MSAPDKTAPADPIDNLSTTDSSQGAGVGLVHGQIPDCIPTSTKLTQSACDIASTEANILDSVPHPSTNSSVDSSQLSEGVKKLSIDLKSDHAGTAATSQSLDSNPGNRQNEKSQNGLLSPIKTDEVLPTHKDDHLKSGLASDHNVANGKSPLPDESSKDKDKSASSSDKGRESSDRPASLNAASALEGGREVSEKILYCGGLNKLATEQDLMAIFSAIGPVLLLKVLHDKNRPSYNYAFVEFESSGDAATALKSLQGMPISGSDIRLNWAYQLATNNSSTLGALYNIFVGDLLPEVDDESLGKAFAKFSSLAQAHVMWDMQTSRLRGYGFVTFMLQLDAEKAIESMNGEMVNGRAIRCNWASHRQPQQQQRFRGYPRSGNGHNRRDRPYGRLDPYLHPQPQMAHMVGYPGSYMPGPPPPTSSDQGLYGNGHLDAFQSTYENSFPPPPPPPSSSSSAGSIPVMSPQLYDIVLRQTPSWQTTVYLGNIAHFTVEQDLIPLLQNFGYIVDFKFQPERGCAFVRFDSHERAALAIVQLAGFTVNGRPLRCGWGKDRLPIPQFYSQVAPHLGLFVPGRQ